MERAPTLQAENMKKENYCYTGLSKLQDQFKIVQVKNEIMKNEITKTVFEITELYLSILESIEILNTPRKKYILNILNQSIPYLEQIGMKFVTKLNNKLFLAYAHNF